MSGSVCYISDLFLTTSVDSQSMKWHLCLSQSHVSIVHSFQRPFGHSCFSGGAGEPLGQGRTRCVSCPPASYRFVSSAPWLGQGLSLSVDLLESLGDLVPVQVPYFKTKLDIRPVVDHTVGLPMCLWLLFAPIRKFVLQLKVRNPMFELCTWVNCKWVDLDLFLSRTLDLINLPMFFMQEAFQQAASQPVSKKTRPSCSQDSRQLSSWRVQAWNWLVGTFLAHCSTNCILRAQARPVCTAKEVSGPGGVSAGILAVAGYRCNRMHEFFSMWIFQRSMVWFITLHSWYMLIYRGQFYSCYERKPSHAGHFQGVPRVDPWNSTANLRPQLFISDFWLLEKAVNLENFGVGLESNGSNG